MDSGARAEYLETISRLADLLAKKNQRLWLFESRGAPGEFVEFREGREGDSLGLSAVDGSMEGRLATRLSELASHAESGAQLWDEVALGKDEGD